MTGRSNDDGDDAVWCEWGPSPFTDLELHDWQARGYDSAVHLLLVANIHLKSSYSDVEVQAIHLMQEPLELQLPAMLAYISFPEEIVTESGLYFEDVEQLGTVV